MVNVNGSDASSRDSHADSMNTIQKLRLAVREQEIYVSQLEEFKAIRSRLLAQLNDTLGRSHLDNSTNIEEAAESLLRGIHAMQEEICVIDGMRGSRLEAKNSNENDIPTEKRRHSQEGKSPTLVFSDAAEAQLSALVEDDLLEEGKGLSQSVSPPIDALLADHKSKEEEINLQKKRRYRKVGQGFAKKPNSNSESERIRRHIKKRDVKHREELFKVLERVVEENPRVFSPLSSTISEQPPWLTNLQEADVTYLEKATEKHMKGGEDYSDDFEDD